MKFSEVMENETRITETENGCIALNTTGEKCLDLFSTVGALRDADNDRITRLFDDAFAEEPLLARKIMFYARDIRGGAKIGERRVFRVLLKHMAMYHTESMRKNLPLVPFYGRWDDLYEFVDTPLEDDMWKLVKMQLEEDTKNIRENKSVSLLAKWLKSSDASSRNTRKLGIYTAQKLGLSVYEYRHTLKNLRKYLDIVERKMSAKEWSDIEYSKVPSKAMLLYRHAFIEHDGLRYQKFISRVLNGEEKINADTLYPYDIIGKLINFGLGGIGIKNLSQDESDALEAEWRNLPNYVGDDNAIVMADTSGSMAWASNGRPFNTALGLAIYFAQRNKGCYNGLWMTFSQSPEFHRIKGQTLCQILKNTDCSGWGMNTNLESAFELVLDRAIENNVSQEEMPKSIIVISDMEIDGCVESNWTFYDEMADRFAEYGYEIPNVVFWNVESRHDIFHADAKRKGVQLVSGQSVGMFKQLINTIGKTPVESMLQMLSDPRYDLVV